MRRLIAVAASLAMLAGPANAAPEPPLAAVTPLGMPARVFSTKRDACDENDQPDAPVRVLRAADGALVMYGLHTQNRTLRGPDLDHLRIDCRSSLPSHYDEDPAHDDDASWITATWSEDGRHVDALVHHEYHASEHPGRCSWPNYLACWYNTVVSVTSQDGGQSFVRPDPPRVVTAAPFRQDVGQGRHRGFFNPSNIAADGRWRYVMIATTGWEGQASGACLFRTATPGDPRSWRAFDGTTFTVRFADPYREAPGHPACKVVDPFPAPVGSITRHRPTGTWIAVFQASKGTSTGGNLFPQAGFYTTSSRDLLHWDAPRLLMAGATLYDDPCVSGARLIAYPSLIDRDAPGRNFDTVGDSADLYYATLRVEGCTVTADRDLLRQRVGIKVLP